MGETEIRTKLVLDDAASATLKNVKAGFDETHVAAQHAQESAHHLASFLTTFTAMNIGPAIHSVYEFGKSFVEAASAASTADRAVAGMFMSATGAKWNEAKEAATGVREELDRIGISSGISLGEVKEGFKSILLISGATKEGIVSARNQIEKMAQVSAVTGISTSEIARWWSIMGTGMLPHATNEIGQLLKSTGAFGDMSEAAGESWRKLTSEERAKVLSGALDHLYGTMKDVQPGFHQMLTSLENVMEVTKEKIGTPILQAIVPELKHVTSEILGARGSVEEFAKGMAVDVGKYVHEASTAMLEGFTWVKTHHEEIKNALVEGWSYAKSVVEFIVAHKEAIAIAYGVKTAAPLLGAGAEVAKSVAGAGAVGIPSLGLAGAAGSAVALGAFAAAILGVGAAAWQAKKLLDETGGGKSDAQQDIAAIQKAFADMAGNGETMAKQWSKAEVDWFNDRRARLLELGKAEGMNTRQMGEQVDAVWNMHRAARAQVDMYQQLADSFNDVNSAGQLPDMVESVDKFSAGLTQAVQSGNQGMAIQIATVLAKHTDLAAAFISGSEMTGAAMDALANMIKGKSTELDELGKQLDAKAKEKGVAAAAAGAAKTRPLTSGNITVHIQQDFRDQDPDRIAVVFERELVRAVENRLGASTAGPFG